MKIVTAIADLRVDLGKAKDTGMSIGFVPTMGYLHEGHLSLIHEAKRKHDIVVLSIFVNPLQFGPNEDFDRYPRDMKRDEELAKANGVDLLFHPSVEEIYPKEMPMTIHVTQGVDTLCGASRPGHFDGVATVVMKLLQIVQPDQAFFGQKDAQQIAVVMNMVNAFNVPTEIVACSTIREEDGLAKSSRNVYLTDAERKEAPFLYETLKFGATLIQSGERKRENVIARLTEKLQDGLGKLDYVEVLSYPALKQEEELKGQIILALAYKYTHARLIDNYIMKIED